MLPRKIPLTPESTPEITQAQASTRSTGTPTRPLISRSLASARIDRPSRLRLRNRIIPMVTAKPSAKAIARVAVTRTPISSKLTVSDGQPQAARPFAPNEFAEAENDQRKAERRHRPHDRIAVGETRRNQAPIEQRQRRRSRDGGNPADPLRTAGIRNLPREAARSTRRARLAPD